MKKKEGKKTDTPFEFLYHLLSLWIGWTFHNHHFHKSRHKQNYYNRTSLYESLIYQWLTHVYLNNYLLARYLNHCQYHSSTILSKYKWLNNQPKIYQTLPIIVSDASPQRVTIARIGASLVAIWLKNTTSTHDSFPHPWTPLTQFGAFYRYPLLFVETCTNRYNS